LLTGVYTPLGAPPRMSALGQKQTCARCKTACPLYTQMADMCGATSDVCLGLEADIAAQSGRFAARMRLEFTDRTG
jgi:hypothetical protein